TRRLSDATIRRTIGITILVIKEAREVVGLEHTCYVRTHAEMTGKYVKRAYRAFDDVGRPMISMEFNDEGAKLFGKVTSANVGRQLAIVLDGELQSAPTIQDAIMGGKAQITGSFTDLEAQR